MMRETVMIPIRFPNESFPIDVLIDLGEFDPHKTFNDITFGWWGDIYVSIENKYLPNEKLKPTF